MSKEAANKLIRLKWVINLNERTTEVATGASPATEASYLDKNSDHRIFSAMSIHSCSQSAVLKYSNLYRGWRTIVNLVKNLMALNLSWPSLAAVGLRGLRSCLVVIVVAS